MVETAGAVFSAQECRLGLDPVRHLVLQGGSGFQEHRHAQDERRGGKERDVERREAKAGGAEQSGKNDPSHGVSRAGIRRM
jgi:hypothetical protein